MLSVHCRIRGLSYSGTKKVWLKALGRAKAKGAVEAWASMCGQISSKLRRMGVDVGENVDEGETKLCKTNRLQGW